MLSDRRSDEPKPERPRILKAHQVAVVQFAFPHLEQVANSDLPPSLSAGPDPASIPAAPPQPQPSRLEEAERKLAEAREAEERARALERRAAAFLTEAEETAHARLTEAQRQIDEMLAKTAAAIDEVEAETKASAYQAGHSEGYIAGIEKAKTQADAVLQQARQESGAITAAARAAAEQILEDARREREAILESAKYEILELTFAMARQVLKAETALRPESVLPMLEAALAKLKGEEEPQVRVSTEVLALLEEQRGRLMAALPGARRLGLEADPSLQPGDFVVQGAQGLIDGRLDSQVRNLEDAIRDEER